MTNLLTIHEITTDKEALTFRVRYYRLGIHKFRITYENSNGYPLGFNSKKCLAEYSRTESKWVNHEDISILNMDPSPNYCDGKASRAHRDEFFRRMEAHIIAVYYAEEE